MTQLTMIRMRTFSYKSNTFLTFALNYAFVRILRSLATFKFLSLNCLFMIISIFSLIRIFWSSLLTIIFYARVKVYWSGPKSTNQSPFWKSISSVFKSDLKLTLLIFIPKIQNFPIFLGGHHVENHSKGLPWNKIKKINIFYAFMDFAKYFRGCIFDVMEHKN